MPEIFNITTEEGRQGLHEAIHAQPDEGLIITDKQLMFGEAYVREDGALVMSEDVSKVFHSFQKERLKRLEQENTRTFIPTPSKN